MAAVFGKSLLRSHPPTHHLNGLRPYFYCQWQCCVSNGYLGCTLNRLWHPDNVGIMYHMPALLWSTTLKGGAHLTIALMSFGSKWRHTALKEGDCLFFTPLWCQRHTNSALPIWEEKVIKSTIKRRTKEAAGARVGWRSEEVTAVNVTRCCRGPDSRYTTSYRCTA